MIDQLYKLKTGARFKLVNTEAQAPPGAPRGDPNEVYYMGRLDGMYCNCYDSAGNMCYFAAWELVDEQT